MADKIERTFPGRTSQEIFDRLLVRLGDVAQRYSLKVESDPRSCSGRVHRTGADVRFKIAGERLDVNLDFSFIVPGAIRQRVKEELSSRLDGLFADAPKQA
jgi:hypothetical protein